MTRNTERDSNGSPAARRRVGLRVRLWVGCFGGAAIAALAIGCVLAFVSMAGGALDPRTVMLALAGAAVAGLLGGVVCALWLQRGVAGSVWRVQRALASGQLPEPRWPGHAEWGEIAELAEGVRALLRSNRHLARSDAEFAETRAEIARLCEAVERWMTAERWEPLTTATEPLRPLAEGLNRGFARQAQVLDQNREVARVVRADLLHAIEDARAAATTAEHGFVEATSLLTTIHEVARLGGEIQQVLQSSAVARDEASARGEERWREEAARSLEQLAAASSESVEHVGNGLLRVQEIASQVQLLSNRATLIALNAVVAAGRPPAGEAGGEGWSTELKQLARDVRAATDRVQELSAEVERAVQSANERMHDVRERVAGQLSELPAVEPAVAPAADVARIAERLREMIQDASRKGGRLSEAGEDASRAAERLARRLEDEARDVEGLVIRLSPAGDEPAATARHARRDGAPAEHLRLIGDEELERDPGEEPHGREERP